MKELVYLQKLELAEQPPLLQLLSGCSGWSYDDFGHSNPTPFDEVSNVRVGFLNNFYVKQARRVPTEET